MANLRIISQFFSIKIEIYLFIKILLLILQLQNLNETLVLQKIYNIAIIPYTIFLLYLMFLGAGREQFSSNIVRLTPIVSTLNFLENTTSLTNIFINIFGNIIMFIPFGFLGWIFPKLNQFQPLIINFLSGLIIIEALQYFTRLGVFDVDDLLLNSLGVWIGFKIWKKLKQS